MSQRLSLVTSDNYMTVRDFSALCLGGRVRVELFGARAWGFGLSFLPETRIPKPGASLYDSEAFRLLLIQGVPKLRTVIESESLYRVSVFSRFQAYK